MKKTLLKIRWFYSALFVLLPVTEILSSVTCAEAENFDPIFRRISLEQGLSQTTIWSMIQDHQGFIWIGTADGLNKYDGYNFTVYRTRHNDSTSISDNKISVIYEDDQNHLWIGTAGGGLNLFDRVNRKFIRIGDNASEINLSNNRIKTIYRDDEDILWVGTYGGGLNRYNLRETSNMVFRHSNDNLQSIPSDRITCMVVDSYGFQWYGTARGLTRFNPKNNTFITIGCGPDLLSHEFINALHLDPDGNLWAGTDKGLNRIPATFVGQLAEGRNADSLLSHVKIGHYFHQPDNKNSLSNNVVWTIFTDSRGVLWIGTDGGGLNRFDIKTGSWRVFQHNPFNSNSLSNDRIRTILEDLSHNIWVGTNNGGISKFSNRPQKFTHYFKNPSGANTLNDNIVYSIFKDGKSNLWIGTYQGGLNFMDGRTGRFRYFLHDARNPISISNNSVRCIRAQNDSLLWIATPNGLNRLHIPSGKFTRFFHIPGDESSIAGNNIRTLLFTEKDVLWIGHDRRGLDRLDLRTGKIKNYRAGNGKNTLPDNRIRSLYRDRHGDLWIGTYGGLSCFQIGHNKFINYYYDERDVNSLSNNYVLSITEDKDGNLWIGTFGGGLNKFNREDGSFKCYNEMNGLPNNVIYGILPDAENNLWLSTNKGIIKFNPLTGQTVVFDEDDGIQALEFNTGAYFKSEDGEMFFGGINGFNRFFPEKIRLDYLLAPVRISKVRIYDRVVKDYFRSNDTLMFQYDDRFLTIDFATMDYSNPLRNRFAYRLIGFESNWIPCGNVHQAAFTGLEPGEYDFEVIGANHDEVWNYHAAKLHIKIIPPFWKTSWFQLPAAFVVLGLLFIVHRVRTRTAWLQNLRLQKEVESRTEDLLKINTMLKEELKYRNEIENALRRAREDLEKRVL